MIAKLKCYDILCTTLIVLFASEARTMRTWLLWRMWDKVLYIRQCKETTLAKSGPKSDLSSQISLCRQVMLGLEQPESITRPQPTSKGDPRNKDHFVNIITGPNSRECCGSIDRAPNREIAARMWLTRTRCLQQPMRTAEFNVKIR